MAVALVRLLTFTEDDVVWGGVNALHMEAVMASGTVVVHLIV